MSDCGGEKHAGVEVDRRDSRHSFIWKLIIDSQAACAFQSISRDPVEIWFTSWPCIENRILPGLNSEKIQSQIVRTTCRDGIISPMVKNPQEGVSMTFLAPFLGKHGESPNDPQKNSKMAMDGLLEPQVKGPGNDFFTCPLRMANDSFSTFPNLPRCTKKDDSSGEEVSC